MSTTKPARLPVIFRAERAKPHHLTAVFPTMTHDTAGNLVTAFDPHGGHCAAARAWYFKTRPCTPEEMQRLRASLEAADYQFPETTREQSDPTPVILRHRWTSAHDRARRDEAAAYRRSIEEGQTNA